MAKPGFSEVASGNLGRLDQLCEAAANVLDCEAAVLLTSIGDVKRVIASHGLPARYKSYEFEFGKQGYDRGDHVVAYDMRDAEEALAFGRRLGIESCRFFLRTPVVTEDDFGIALAVLGCEQHKKPAKAKLAALEEIIGVAASELKSRKAQLSDVREHVTVAAPLSRMISEVNGADQAVALLDGALTYIAASKPLCALQGEDQKSIAGKRYADLAIPAAGAMERLMQHALKTRVSPPGFEIVVEDEGSARRIYRVTIAPFSPTDTKDYFLYVSMSDATTVALAATKLGAQGAGKKPPPREPSLVFLLETLVPRRAIRERKSVNYLTLMSWRQGVRDYQIAALKALKQNIPPEMPGAIADLMAREIDSLLGAQAFVAVVPMPCGHSDDSHCLSEELARALGAKLGLPVIRALAAKKQTGSSHPKNNVRRPPMQAVEKLTGPVILVDDVATSGAHIEEAVKLLKPSGGAVFPVVWISGDRV
jgi:predicted amidophosphoribosyltransferase/PAS domain-containing protein